MSSSKVLILALAALAGLAACGSRDVKTVAPPGHVGRFAAAPQPPAVPTDAKAPAQVTDDGALWTIPETNQRRDTDAHRRVLVVINTASQESQEIGAYYRAKRRIPSANVVLISVSRTDNVSSGEYEAGIERPIKEAIAKSAGRIDYIVLTKGVPIRLDNDNGDSVDGRLASMNLGMKPLTELNEAGVRRLISPYFEANEPFSSEKFGMFLVTRLDGYTVADAKRLVDNSLSAKPRRGPFVLDAADNRRTGGYAEMQATLFRANDLLRQRGLNSFLDDSPTFIVPDIPMMGYASWGSNDVGFNFPSYRRLKFVPGAIGETFVSTSGRTFQGPQEGGQSMSGDLIAQGITGIKGYVSEPYTFALAHPQILFDRYTRGFNLAESFYAASMVTHWKDVVIGDPLCAPYARP